MLLLQLLVLLLLAMLEILSRVCDDTKIADRRRTEGNNRSSIIV